MKIKKSVKNPPKLNYMQIKMYLKKNPHIINNLRPQRNILSKRVFRICLFVGRNLLHVVSKSILFQKNLYLVSSVGPGKINTNINKKRLKRPKKQKNLGLWRRL
jgi:hypothetical protein